VNEFALIYIFNQTLLEIFEFFIHWYVGGYRNFSRRLVGFLAELDRLIAFRITLHYFGKPLFQDKSLVGYILGFFFRSSRLLLGGIFYIFVILLAVCLYVAWAAVIPFIIFKIVVG